MIGARTNTENAVEWGAFGALFGAMTGAALAAGSTCPAMQAGVGEQLSFGGVGVQGFGLAQKEATMTTPAQASPGFDFATDVPVQGPTDPGMREADCRFVQTVLPKRPACADCGGSLTMRQFSSGQIALNGVGVRGFALSAAGDPEVWTKISSEQQAWVMNTLVKFDQMIRSKTGTSCPTFGPSITAAGGCFQAWFNANTKGSFTKPDGSPLVLRTDGVFDQDTLDALRTVVALHPTDFPTPFPGTEMAGTGEKKLSKGAIIGIAVAGATVVGGGVWLATRKKRRSR
jgi:hypothetical protein